MSIHDLKTWPEPFAAVVSGAKTFEVRRNDRQPGYQVGDVLRLREWAAGYTGRSTSRRVTYVCHLSAWIPGSDCDGFVVLGIAKKWPEA